jgi:hypothetical protein
MLGDPVEHGCNLAFGGDPDASAFQQSIDLFGSRPSQWDTLASETEQLGATQPGVQPTDTREVWAARRDLGGGRRSLGTLPLVVLQAGDLSEFPFPPDVLSCFRQVRTEMLDRLAAQSKRGMRVLVPDAPHYIQNYQPQAVIDAIRQVVCAAQADTSAGSGTGCEE